MSESPDRKTDEKVVSLLEERGGTALMKEVREELDIKKNRFESSLKRMDSRDDIEIVEWGMNNKLVLPDEESFGNYANRDYVAGYIVESDTSYPVSEQIAKEILEIYSVRLDRKDARKGVEALRDNLGVGKEEFEDYWKWSDSGATRWNLNYVRSEYGERVKKLCPERMSENHEFCGELESG